MAGHPLRSATDRRFGGSLPRQLANQTRIHPVLIESFHTRPCGPVRLCGISSRFQLLSPCTGQVIHALLTRPPLGDIRKHHLVRLACVKHAASVNPEPGSNSHVKSPDPVRLKLSFFSFRYCVASISRWLLGSFTSVFRLLCSNVLNNPRGFSTSVSFEMFKRIFRVGYTV